jgi:hypothetical protein
MGEWISSDPQVSASEESENQNEQESEAYLGAVVGSWFYMRGTVSDLMMLVNVQVEVSVSSKQDEEQLLEGSSNR